MHYFDHLGAFIVNEAKEFCAQIGVTLRGHVVACARGQRRQAGILAIVFGAVYFASESFAHGRD